MKKITFFFMMLLSITAFSQIEIVENFDSTPNNQVPAGWTNVSMGASPSYVCGGAGSSIYTSATAGSTASLTTPNYAAISNGTNLTASFSYNIYEQVSQFPPPSFTAPATDWGSLVLEYSTDGGSNWTTITTIDDSNYTFGDRENCQATANISVGTIANASNFQARFVVNAVNVNGFRLIVVIDNVVIVQEGNAIPNCDATLLSPLNGSTTADTDASLIWQRATGLATGYKVSVGTSMGGTDIVNAATTTETSYSLAGLGLTYNTLYYVNIVPYNGFGDATNGCIEESFTTRLAPIAGATCGSPHVVDMFPYIVPTDDTANYENNVNTGSCGTSDTSYILGNDVFYEITPTTDMSINIDLAQISNNGASMHLMKGCPTDVDKECIDFVGTFSTTGGSLNISDAVLLAGNTYFLVLSNSSSSRTYSYSLIITQNTCINPAFTLTNVSECSTGEFTIDVDITYLGDSASLTLTDNFGYSDANINTTGIYNVGPYNSGTVVELTLTTNTPSETCFYTNSTYFYCPPVNDDCGDALDLTSTINTDGTCTMFTSATNAGATDSLGDPAACSGNTNDVWFSFVANGATMILEFLNVESAPGTPSGAIVQSVELLEGNCGSLTSLGCYTGGTSGYVEFHGLTNGNSYYVRNKSNTSGEYAQNYDICLKTAPAPPVNDACANATTLTLSTSNACDNLEAGTTTGATISAENSCNTSSPYKDVWYVFTPSATAYYEFQYTRIQTSPASNYTIFEGTCGALTQKSSSCSSTSNQILYLTSGLDYYILVRSANTGPTSGIDFELCVWQLPPAASNSDCSNPTTLVESSDFNGNNTISGNLDNSYNSPEGCSSSSYESVWYSFTPSLTGLYNFDFTRVSGSAYYTVYNTDDCSQTGTAGYITTCYGSADLTGDLVAGTTYLIMVHASSAASFDLFAYPDPALSIESNNFETFTYYPNPVNSIITIEAKNTISSISIYNIVGQQVQSINPNNIKTTLNMGELKNGMYFITVTINNTQQTIKVIKK